MKLDRFGETVRLSVIGLGRRGISQLKTLLDMPDVEITAVCDVYPDRVAEAAEIIEAARGRRPFTT